MSATFFPPEVQRAISNAERWLDCTDDSQEEARRLLDELRRWEREWRAGRTRLGPQVEAKPNGEGGL